MLEVHRYEGLLRPDASESDQVDWVPDGVLAVEDGKIVFAGPRQEVPDELKAVVDQVVQRRGIATSPTANAHGHAFQPHWNRDELIELKEEKMRGSLLPTLRSETEVRNNPDLATDIAHEMADSMIDNGIAEAVIYTTSSIPALRNMLKVFCERGFRGRVKLGYVFMNQNMNKYQGQDIEGVDLELAEADEDAVFDELRELNGEYSGMLTVIDRFPIAVNRRLRERLVSFCKETKLDFDTHVDESEGEAGFTSFLYEGARIDEELEESGIFTLNAQGQVVRLAHGVLTQKVDFERLKRAKEAGVAIEVVACPSSNLNIRSHWINYPGTNDRSKYVPFPVNDWKEVASVRLGIDSGAGVTASIFNEAVLFVIRDPQGAVTWSDAFHSARAHSATLQTGAPADWVHVHPDQVNLLNNLSKRLTSDELRKEIVKHTLIGATAQGGVEAMYLAGQRMQSRNPAERPRLHF